MRAVIAARASSVVRLSVIMYGCYNNREGKMAIDNPFYSHEHHGEYDVISIGRLDLEEGGTYLGGFTALRIA